MPSEGLQSQSHITSPVARSPAPGACVQGVQDEQRHPQQAPLASDTQPEQAEMHGHSG